MIIIIIVKGEDSNPKLLHDCSYISQPKNYVVKFWTSVKDLYL